MLSDLQSLQDKRYLFFLVSKLPDKNIPPHLSLFQSLHILREPKPRFLRNLKNSRLFGGYKINLYLCSEKSKRRELCARIMSK